VPLEVEAIVYYPLGNWWERLPLFPKEFDIRRPNEGKCHCVYVKSKHHLIVMGLHSGFDKKAAILMFDFLSRTWRLAIPQMPDSQIFYPRHLNAFVYNLEEDQCYALPPIELDCSYLNGCVGAFHNDKYYVFPRGQSIQIYDQCVSSFGSLYFFDYMNGNCLTMKEFDVACNTFTMFSRHPKRGIYCAVPWNDCIFITSASCTETFGVDYYLFHVREKEEGKIWTYIEMPAQLPRFSPLSSSCFQHKALFVFADLLL
jgi:hypothetical protein